MADIFISYKRENREVAERLAYALEQLGFDVWWDFELLSGDRFRRVIEEVINQCKAAIVLWSRLSRESEFVLDEAAYAKDQGKLCPARIDDCRLPLGFGNVQTDDLRGWNGELTHAGLATLLRAVEGRVGRKARLGGRIRTEQDEERARDLESFKASQIAGTPDALHAYLRLNPTGAFVDFVRLQLEEIARREQAGPTPPTVHAASRSPRAQAQPLSASSRPSRPVQRRDGSPAPVIIGALFVAAAALGSLLWMNQWGTPVPQSAAQAPALETAASVAVPQPRPAKPAVKLPADDDSVFASAENANTPAAFEAYIEAFPNGRYVEEAKVALAELRAAEKRATPSTPYDLGRLHADVRRAAEAARTSRARAETAATAGREAAAKAEETTLRAKAGEPGYINSATPSQNWTIHSMDNLGGVGVMRVTSGPSSGDFYAGEWRDLKPSGAGVYSHAENQSNVAASLRYEGDFSHGHKNGFGIMYWRNGDKHFGGENEDLKTGPGVSEFANGYRYEGEFDKDTRNGFGVEWDGRGQIARAGVWSNGKLTAALEQ